METSQVPSEKALRLRNQYLGQDLVDVLTAPTPTEPDEFGKWMEAAHQPIDFVWRLAEEKGIVLMDGGGFAAPEMSVRVSLANLFKVDYDKIGHGISDLLEEYKKEWEAAKSK